MPLLDNLRGDVGRGNDVTPTHTVCGVIPSSPPLR